MVLPRCQTVCFTDRNAMQCALRPGALGAVLLGAYQLDENYVTARMRLLLYNYYSARQSIENDGSRHLIAYVLIQKRDVYYVHFHV